MHRLAILSVALLLLVTGCLGTPTSPGTNSPTVTTTGGVGEPQTERSPTEGIDFDLTNCSDAVQWVAFYNLGNAGEYDLWTKQQASIGYTVHGNASVFFVAYSAGERLGAEHVSTVDYETGFQADGHSIQFDEPLEERRSIRIVAHRDVDRDGTFDPDTDLACENDGDLVSTDVAVVSFGELTTETPGTSTGK
ncbi:MAG: hypothetical protein ACI9EZ_002125 [Halobacteriales archaeon]|jgi:hypothetical protein